MPAGTPQLKPAGTPQLPATEWLAKPFPVTPRSMADDPFKAAVPVLKKAAAAEQRADGGIPSAAPEAIRLYQDALALLELALVRDPPYAAKMAGIIQQKASDVRDRIVELDGDAAESELEPEPDDDDAQPGSSGKSSFRGAISERDSFILSSMPHSLADSPAAAVAGQPRSGRPSIVQSLLGPDRLIGEPSSAPALPTLGDDEEAAALAEMKAANAVSTSGPRVRNVDKRTSRIDHRDSFQRAIVDHRATLPSAIGTAAAGEDVAAFGINVCVRKRPLFPHEIDAGDYDATTVTGRRMIVHDGRMKPDMVHMEMRHHQYSFPRVFDEYTNNDTVYSMTASPLVRHATQGGIATVFMFGQTGSGKTFTMSAIHERAVKELFSLLSGDAAVIVSYVELAGSSCRDMLNGSSAVELMSDKRGEVQLVGVAELQAHGAEELLEIMTAANDARATCATGVHDQSSRSHAVCRVTIRRAGHADGMFTMVDLAGSERSKDSMYHDAQMQKETAEINESLMALKNCVRELSSNATHVNFRGSSLTQVLKSCFTDANACTVVIATVAPSSGDTDHTLGTLSHAMLMDGQKDGSQTETRVLVRSAAEIHAAAVRASAPKDPKKWTKEEAKAWWGPAAASCLARAEVPLEEGVAAPFPRGALNGKVISKWPVRRFQQELGNDNAGESLFKMYKKAVVDQADLRKGVAAVRRGDVAPANTTSSSSGARAGTPGSSAKKVTAAPAVVTAAQEPPQDAALDAAMEISAAHEVDCINVAVVVADMVEEASAPAPAQASTSASAAEQAAAVPAPSQASRSASFADDTKGKKIFRQLTDPAFDIPEEAQAPAPSPAARSVKLQRLKPAGGSKFLGSSKLLSEDYENPTVKQLMKPGTSEDGPEDGPGKATEDQQLEKDPLRISHLMAAFHHFFTKDRCILKDFG